MQTLENDSDLPPAKAIQGSTAEPRQHLPGNGDPAALRRQQPCNQVQ